MTNCNVFTKERWELLLNNRLGAKEKNDLLDHLAGECPDCQKFLEEMTEDDEAALLARFDEPAMHADSLITGDADKAKEFRTVLQGVNIPKQRESLWQQLCSSMALTRKSMMPVWAGGFAMLMLAVVLLPRINDPEISQPTTQSLPQRTAKSASPGILAVPEIHLEFATGQRQADGGLDVRRGVLGAQYKDADTLFLHYRISEQGYVYLLARQDDMDIKPLFSGQPSRQQAGEYDAPANDMIQGIPLEGLRGRYSIISVYSQHPLDVHKQLIPGMRRSLDPTDGGIDQKVLRREINANIAIDQVYFDVRS